MTIVAWQGGLELLDAAWSLKSGRTVEFNVIQEEGAPLELHPFAGFVKRRGNRVGTRFHLSLMAIGAEDAAYDGQVMLMGGGSPLGKPQTVKFWLDEEGDVHPFMGFHARNADSLGQVFMAVFVELAPDETPVDQTQRNLLENATAKRDHSLSRLAAMLCQSSLFHHYLAETVPADVDPDKYQDLSPPGFLFLGPDHWADGPRAANWMRQKCEVASRADFDRDDEAAIRFHNEVRRPYATWCQENGYDDLGQ